MNNDKHYYRDMTVDDFASELVGKVVTFVDTNNNTITLSDGTTLQLEDTTECCAYFEAQLQVGNLTDNAITGVQVSGNVDDENYSINVFAADTRVLDAHIEGDSTSGYYCHSIDIAVKRG